MTAMRPHPLPANEPARSATVDAMDLMARRADPFFAGVTSMVRQILGTPIAFISLFSGDRQDFLRIDGIDLAGTQRDMSLCAFTIAARETIILPDTHADPRSREHPVVTRMGVRFSASAPVITSRGFCLGTVCGIDLAPRPMPNADQVAMLTTLGAMVARYYEVPVEPDPDKVALLRQIADDAQKEFLALIGHEMRTPLNGIHGMAQLLDPRDDDQAEIAAAILASAEHLNAVVGSVLHFTELASGDIRLQESRVRLDTLVDRAMAGFRGLARLRGKTLARGGQPGGLTVTVDAAQMELALSCLLSNAVMHGGAAITVVTRALGDGSATVEVVDDGPGIAPAYEARVWDAFGVGGRVRTRAADGIGLGLPLTRRIADLHGAELHLLRGDGRMTAMLRLPAWRRAADG